MQGRAAFLLPLALMVPWTGKPPSITYRYMAEVLLEYGGLSIWTWRPYPSGQGSSGLLRCSFSGQYEPSMKIMKFGGTSVKDAGRIRGIEDIIRKEDLSDGLIVVCSAMKGITDDLLNLARKAEGGDLSYEQLLAHIWQRQEDALAVLFPAGSSHGRETRAALELMKKEMHELANGIHLIRECSTRSLDLMGSFGERLNNTLIAGYFRSQGLDATYVDARELILTDSTWGNAAVDFGKTYARTQAWFTQAWGKEWKGKIALVTGFVAANAEGVTTTLGRNGSDYTAAILGAALQVADIEIWTDVDGVLSADPRVVPDAFVIPDLGVDEAMEMCYFGAEVLHPYTIIPAVEKNIPIWIKNTMNPSARGTRIARDVQHSGNAITGLASIRKVGIINIQGGGMMGAKGVASRIFAALAKADVNIIMISQASSEHSICVVLREDECHRAVRVLQKELAALLSAKLLNDIEHVSGVEIVSVIGANMRGTPGVSAKIFGALGQAKVNVLVIAQGSSEMNVSFVIEQKDHVQALNALHGAFFSGGKK